MSPTPNPINLNPIMRSCKLYDGSQLPKGKHNRKYRWFPVGPIFYKRSHGSQLARRSWFLAGPIYTGAAMILS